MDDLSYWVKTRPFVTRTLLLGTVMCTLLQAFKLVAGRDLAFDFDSIVYRFNIWRLFTPFVNVGGLGLPFVMHCFILYQNCMRYEESPFNTGAGGTSADFLFMVILGMLVSYTVPIFIDPYADLADMLLFMIMQVWSRRNPEVQLNFYGMPFKGKYCPWVYVAVRLVLGGNPLSPLYGIVIGHLYYYLHERFEPFQTPRFCVEIVNYFSQTVPPRTPGFTAVQGGFGRGAAAPTAPAQNNTGSAPSSGRSSGGSSSSRSSYSWGTGRRLGTD